MYLDYILFAVGGGLLLLAVVLAMVLLAFRKLSSISRTAWFRMPIRLFTSMDPLPSRSKITGSVRAVWYTKSFISLMVKKPSF